VGSDASVVDVDAEAGLSPVHRLSEVRALGADGGVLAGARGVPKRDPLVGEKLGKGFH